MTNIISAFVFFVTEAKIIKKQKYNKNANIACTCKVTKQKTL